VLYFSYFPCYSACTLKRGRRSAGLAALKKTALGKLVLIAGFMATSAVVSADANVYGSIRLAVVYTDTDDTDDVSVADRSSRVGLQGNEVVEDVTAFARWEWGVAADTQDSQLTTRLGFVGLSGDFGAVSFGSQWSAWDTFVGGTHTNIVEEGEWHNGTERNGDTLKYAGKVGEVSVEADAVLVGQTDSGENSGAIDELQVALGYNFGAFALQAGVISRDGGADGYLGGGTLVGGRLTYKRGPLVLSAALARDDDEFGGAEETTGVKLRAGYRTGPNQFLLVVTQANNNVAGNSPGAIAVGYQFDLSKRSRVALEMASVDPDIAGPDSSIEGGVMFRHDW
jgi:predicted porin